MSEQLVSTDPNYGINAAPPSAVGAHPEARMSAAQPGLAWAGDAGAVTLNDLKADPIGAMKQIAASVGRDVSDPKLWLSMAASYFGPKVFNMAAPVVARAAGAAAGAAARGAGAVDLHDVVDMVPLGKNIKAGVTIASKVGTALRNQGAPPVEPVSSGPVVPTPQAVPVGRTAAPPPSVEAPPSGPPPATMGPDGLLVGRPGGNPSMPDQKALNETALVQRQAEYQARQAAETRTPAPPPPPQKFVPTPAEMAEYMRLIKAGKSHAEAGRSIVAQRALGAMTDAERIAAQDARYTRGEVKTPSAETARANREKP